MSVTGMPGADLEAREHCLSFGWKTSLLSELVQVRYGKGVAAAQRLDSGVPYVASAGPMDFVADGLVEGPAIVVGRKGSVGNVQYFDGPVWPSDTTFYFDVPQELDGRFLSYQLQVAGLRKLDQSTAVPGLPRPALEAVVLHVAPLAEQKRIVAELERRLSHVDQAVRGLTRAQRQVMATRRSVLNATASGALLHLDAVGWKAVTTGDVCGVRGGIQKQPKRMPKNNPHPFLRVANVGRGNLDLAEVHEVELFGDELETYALQAGDLLVVEGNGSVDQIGRAAIWDGSIANCVHQNHLIRVRPGKAVDAHFLSLVWNAPVTVEQLRAVASSSSGLHTLSTGKIKSVRLHLPPLTDQVALVAEAQRRLSLLDAADRSISAGLSKAEQLRRSLLAAAFSGKLVPQDPNDEPAAVLLDKIRAEREEAAAAAKDAKAATKTTKKPAVRKTSVRKKETQS